MGDDIDPVGDVAGESDLVRLGSQQSGHLLSSLFVGSIQGLSDREGVAALCLDEAIPAYDLIGHGGGQWAVGTGVEVASGV